MGVDVVHVLDREARVLERHLHGSRGALPVGVGRGDVVGVGAEAVAGELGVNPGPALDGVLVALENQHARTLAHDESLPLCVEGPAGPLRLTVALAQRLHRAETAHGELGDARLAPPRHHDVGDPPLDEFHRIADGVVARGACGHRAGVGALQPPAHGHLAGGQVGEQHRNEEGAQPLGPFCLENVLVGFYRRKPAQANADDRPPAVPYFFLGRLQASVLKRHLRGGDDVLDEGVHLLDFFALNIILGLETLHLSADLRGQPLGVEPCHPADPGFPRNERIPILPQANPERGDQPHSSYDDAYFVWHLG